MANSAFSMMTKTSKILQYPHQVLTNKCEQIDTFTAPTKKLVTKMKFVLMMADNGIGLAAPQIGESKRIFVYQDPEDNRYKTILNPQIVSRSDETVTEYEGCLSLADLYFPIERHKEVVLEGVDIFETPMRIEASGLLARLFQHECDHLDGTLIVEYLTDEQKDSIKIATNKKNR